MFIDEISEAPLSVQVKLLRVLQEKQFSRIGGDSLITANFRLITASNKPLKAQVDAGEFRQDLWYRINILELALPALHERPGDVMLIVQHPAGAARQNADIYPGSPGVFKRVYLAGQHS